MEEIKYLGTKEMAERMGVRRKDVMPIIRNSGILYEKIGGRYKVVEETFEKWNKETSARKMSHLDMEKLIELINDDEDDEM